MNDDILKSLAEKYGTPTFVFDAKEVRRRAVNIKRIMNEGLEAGEIKLCYSIKANPFLIPTLMNTVDSFEVCSPGELSICEKLEVPAEKIIYSGVNKGQQDVLEAIEYGVGTITCESIRHYELVCGALEKCDRKVSVILRLTSKSQFGMSIEDIESIIERNKSNNRISIDGIHYFAGTQRVKLKHQRQELLELAEIFDSLRNKFGIDLKKFEYGPGLMYPYFEGDDFSDTLMPLKELSEDLRAAAGFSDLTVEMGRFLASSCGYYLTGVADVKRSGDRNWCILDGGMNHVNYLGSMMGLKVPVIRFLSSRQEGMEESWALCGSLCTTNDVLVRDMKMNAPRLNDIMAFCNIGAYSVTEGINLFLSRSMPKVVIFDNENDILVRDTLESYCMNLPTM